MSDIVQTQMTAEEFHKSSTEHLFMQLIDGELIVSAGATDKHQATSLYTVGLLLSLNIGGTLRFSPVDVEFDSMHVFQPDIFWIAPNSTHCVLSKPTVWLGAPDLVIEILSPSTVRNDQVRKFQIYERYGVGEYWILDPDAETLAVWVLQNAEYTRQGIYRPGEQFTSSILNGQQVIVAHCFAAP